MTRYFLIVCFVVTGLAGVAVLASESSRVIGIALIVVSAGLGSISKVLEWRDGAAEKKAQREWVRRIKALADDLSLEGYGVTALEDLASYHDAEGRTEILQVLQSQSPGQRRLLVAARVVDKEGTWQ